MRQLLGTIQLVVAIALMALVAQAVLYVLAGQNRDKNLFYQIVRIIPSPFVKLFRLLTPQGVRGPGDSVRHVLRSRRDLPVARLRHSQGRAMMRGAAR